MKQLGSCAHMIIVDRSPKHKGTHGLQMRHQLNKVILRINIPILICPKGIHIHLTHVEEHESRAQPLSHQR